VCRYDWHSTGSHGLTRPISNAKIKKIRKQFYQTALGNCYGLKSTKMLIAVLKNKFIVSLIIIFGTLSFPMCACISDKTLDSGHDVGKCRPIFKPFKPIDFQM